MTQSDVERYAAQVAQNQAGAPYLNLSPMELRRDIERVLVLVGEQPEGASLNERWHHTGMDSYIIAMSSTPEGVPRAERQGARFAYRALVRDRLIDPSPEVALTVRTASLIIHTTEIDADKELQRVAKCALDRGLVMTAKAMQANMRALAAVKVTFRKDLAEISPHAWRSLQEIREGMVGQFLKVDVTPERFPGMRVITDGEISSLGAPYAWAAAAGAMLGHDPSKPPGMRVPLALRAVRRAPFSVETIVAKRGRKIPPTVARVLELALNIAGSGFDRSPVIYQVYAMNAFYKAVGHVLPNCDTLEVPRDRIDEIVRVMRFRDDRDGFQVERTAMGSLLGAVRGVYDLIAEALVEAPEVFQDLASAAPGARFPVAKMAIRNFRKAEKASRRVVLGPQVRQVVNDLENLSRSAEGMLHAGTLMVDAARGAEPGDTFTLGPLEWERGQRNALVADGAVEVPLVREAGTNARYQRADDLGLAITRNAALWLLSRYTGMRTEELGEADLDNLTTTPGVDADPIPILRIPASKGGRPHTVVLQPEAMETVRAIVGAMRRRFGTYPYSPRFDALEQVDQPPRRLLFVSVGDADLHGPDLDTIRDWMGTVKRWQLLDIGESIPEQLTSQMMRRARASELNDAGVNLFAVMENLGHAHVGTTEIYTYPDDERMTADLLKAVAAHR